MRELHRRRGQGDAGLTLIELTVTMAITAILAIAVSALFAGLAKTVSFTTGTTDTTAEARVAIEAMTSTLRSAIPYLTNPAMMVAKSDTVSFYASLDRSGGTNTGSVTPTLVTFAWNGSSCITRTQADPVAGTSSSTCIMRTTTAPVFSYYTSPTGSTPLTVPGSGLILSDRQSVDSVGITLTGTKAASGGRTATSQVQDRITLSNCLTTAC